MKGLLALAVGLALTTIAGAQQKPVTNTHLLSRQANNFKGEPAHLPVISRTQSLTSTTLVLDVSGNQSWDSLFDSSNTVLNVPIPAGSLMTGIGWDVNLVTQGLSWLSEAVFYFDGSDLDAYGLFLTPGFADGFPGTGAYSSAVIDLTDNGIPDIPIQADGILYIQMFESFDDIADAVDADWVGPSTLTIVYDDPPGARCPIWVEDFDSGVWPPAGWLVVDNTGSGSWNINTFFGRANSTGGSGDCAAIDSDFYGSGVSIDGELWTAPFDLPAEPTQLEFLMDYNYLGGDFADVDISTDGGSSWTNLAHYASDIVGGQVVDLSAYAGTTGVIIRFRYVSGWDWWWLVDDVSLFSKASSTWRNAGTNPDSYTIAGPPVLGGTFDAAIDVGSTGHTMGELYGYTTPTTTTLGGGQTLLVNSADPFGELLGLAPVAGPIVTYSITVPTDCAFAGFTFSTQALHYGGAQPFLLSNAHDLVIGD